MEVYLRSPEGTKHKIYFDSNGHATIGRHSMVPVRDKKCSRQQGTSPVSLYLTPVSSLPVHK